MGAARPCQNSRSIRRSCSARTSSVDRGVAASCARRLRQRRTCWTRLFRTRKPTSRGKCVASEIQIAHAQCAQFELVFLLCFLACSSLCINPTLNRSQFICKTNPRIRIKGVPSFKTTHAKLQGSKRQGRSWYFVRWRLMPGLC